MVIFNGTKADTEFQECNADLSVIGYNMSCTINNDEDIGEFKCLSIRKNPADDDEGTDGEINARDDYIPITLVSFAFKCTFKGDSVT